MERYVLVYHCIYKLSILSQFRILMPVFQESRGSEVGRGAVLQAGKQRVQTPMRLLDFFFQFN
jgi:hypothetical protein